jgi:hypothetical protein
MELISRTAKAGESDKSAAKLVLRFASQMLVPLLSGCKLSTRPRKTASFASTDTAVAFALQAQATCGEGKLLRLPYRRAPVRKPLPPRT